MILQFGRFLMVLWRAWRARSQPYVSETRTSFRVRWLDCDTYGHMNNARYLGIMDIARTEYILRTGVLAAARRHGLKPVVVEVHIRYRRELKPGTRFVVRTVSEAVDRRVVRMRQQFLVGERVHADAEVALLWLSRDGVATPEQVRNMFDEADRDGTLLKPPADDLKTAVNE